jgi:hypothetical protein
MQVLLCLLFGSRTIPMHKESSLKAVPVVQKGIRAAREEFGKTLLSPMFWLAFFQVLQQTGDPGIICRK